MKFFDFFRRVFRKNIANTDLLNELQEKIGYKFNDVNLLRQALTHRSYVYENNLHGIDSNERMEFLGDSVLDIIVSEYLYHHFPKRREGKLTKIRGLLVSRAVLADQAKLIDLGKYMIMGMSANSVNSSILADAYEALVCALYLDGGIEPAQKFISKNLLTHFKDIVKKEKHINYKSLLQEHVQASQKLQPDYHVINVTGPDHQREYTVEVCVNGDRMGVGKGKSKKEAEQESAKSALNKFDYWENNE